MLPKSNRLKKSNDFNIVLQKGRGFRNNSLVFKIYDNNLNISRFGFIISRKVSKKAVIRNKIRRQLQEVTRKNLPDIKTNIDGVFIVQPGFNNYTFKNVNKLIQFIFRKADII